MYIQVDITPEEIKGILALLDGVSDTAIDVFWGNQIGITEEERDSFTVGDFNEAFSRAKYSTVLEIGRRKPNEKINVNDWLSYITNMLAEFYGEELHKILLAKAVLKAGRPKLDLF